MAGQRVCDLYAYGLVQHIPHKSYTAQIYYATTFAVFYFPFADPSRIFRGHMLKPFYINANTRTFRSMLIYIYYLSCKCVYEHIHIIYAQRYFCSVVLIHVSSIGHVCHFQIKLLTWTQRYYLLMSHRRCWPLPAASQGSGSSYPPAPAHATNVSDQQSNQSLKPLR